MAFNRKICELQSRSIQQITRYDVIKYDVNLPFFMNPEFTLDRCLNF